MAVTQVASYEKETGGIAAGATGTTALAAFTPVAGETIVVWFTSGGESCQPSGAPAVSGGITWTQRIARAVASTAPIYCWTGVAPATPTAVTVSVPWSNATGTFTTAVHVVAQRFSGATLPTTPNAVSTPAAVTTATTGGGTGAITTASANSAVAWIGADWNGVVSGTPTLANADTLAQSYLGSGVLADWAAFGTRATAGATTYGFSSFSTSAARKLMFAAIELPPTPTGPVTYTSARQATFDSGTIPAAFPTSYGTTVVGGRLRISATNAGTGAVTYSGLKTAADGAGTDHFDDFYFQATQVTGSGAGASAPSMSWIVSASQPAGTRIGWEYDPNAGTLNAKSQVGYNDAAAVALTYSATTHAWWRVRNDGTNVTWQTSADGTTWTTRRTMATPAWANGADIQASLEAYRSTGVTDFFEVDNVNTPPAPATTGLTFTLDMTQANAVAAGAQDTPWNRETATSGGGDTSVPWPPVIQAAPTAMGGGRAVKFTVPAAYKRYEMVPNAAREMQAGDTLYFGGAVYLDTDGISVNATNFQVVWQWRQDDNTGSPSAAIEIIGGAIKLTGGYGIDTVNPARLQYSQTLLTGAVTGHRYNIVARITNFATTESTSKIDIWIDGVQRLTNFTIPPATIIGGGNYWKQGVYHDPANPGGTVWHAAVKIGGSYAAVDPTPVVSGQLNASGSAVSGSRAQAAAVRAEAIPSSPEPGADALQARTLSEVRLWENWLATNNATGFIGEFGVPGLYAKWGDQPQQDQWNALLDAYLRELDRGGLHGAVWASGRNWGSGYPEGLHVGTNVGDPLSIRNATVTPTAAHPSRGGLHHGVNLAGFDHAVGTAGGGNVRTDAGYAHTAADFAFIATDGIDHVRLPIVWEQLQPALSAALSTTALATLDGVLSAAAANGVSVTLDLHNYGRYTQADGTVLVLGGALTTAHLSDFWTRLSDWLRARKSYKVRDLTGPGQTDAYGIGGTDLGVTATAPDGRLVSVFGDTFEQAGVGGAGWRAPVALFGTGGTAFADGIDWTGSAGPAAGDYAEQIIGYTHNGTLNGYTVSTVIPTDLITLGSTMYLHVAGMNPFPTVAFTAIYQSTDNGQTWSLVPGLIWPGSNRGGYFQLPTMCDGGDGYVYLFSTGFQRDKGLIQLRAPISTFTNLSTWQDWVWNGTAWGWTTTVPTAPSVTLAGSFGELCARRVSGQWVLVGFDAGNYRIDVRALAGPTDNLYAAPVRTAAQGVGWDQEDHANGKVAQLYGGYVVPGSTADNFHLVISQWNTSTNWPYRAMQFRVPLPLTNGASAAANSAVVALGLMNEPHDVTGGVATWQSASQAVLTAIRNGGDTRLIAVAGYAWSSLTNWSSTHPTGWITDPQQGGFVYEAHHYWDTATIQPWGPRSGNYQQSNGTGGSQTLTYATELAAATTQTGATGTAVSGSQATAAPTLTISGVAKAVSGTSASAATTMAATVAPSGGVSASLAVASAISENLPVGIVVSGSTAALAPSVMINEPARGLSGSLAVSAETIATGVFGAAVSGSVAILLSPGVIPSVYSDVVSGSLATTAEQRETFAAANAVSGSRTTVVEIRQTFTDPTARRSGTVAQGPTYFDATAGAPAATFLLESYPGPEGGQVGRLSRTPGTAQGWGTYLAADITGSTIPAGTQLTITWWARGTSQAAGLDIVDDPGSQFVGHLTVTGGGAIDTSAWTRYTATTTLTGGGWVPGTHRLRTNLAAADTDWLEWSDVLVTVGALTPTAAVSGSLAYAAPTYTQPAAGSARSGSVVSGAGLLTMGVSAKALSASRTSLEAAWLYPEIGAKGWSGSLATVAEQLTAQAVGVATSGTLASAAGLLTMAVSGTARSASIVFAAPTTEGSLAPSRSLSGSRAVGLGVQVAPAAGSSRSGSVVTGGIVLGYSGGLLVVVSGSLALGTAAAPIHPVFVRPTGTPKPQDPRPTTTLLVVETITGRVVSRLPFSALSWSAGLNKQTSCSATLVLEESLDILADQRVRDPRAALHAILVGEWRFSLVPCYGSIPLVGGPLQPSQDIAGGLVQVGAVGLERVLEKRILNKATGTGLLTDPSRDITFMQTTPAGALYRLVQEAITPYNGRTTRQLPIACSSPVTMIGDRDFTWPAFDLQNVWKAMTDIAADVDGPDFRLDPVLVQTGSGPYVYWNLEIGNPALPVSGRAGPDGPLPWTFAPSRDQITRQLTAADLVTVQYATGDGQDRAKTIMQASNDTLTALGWPDLEAADAAPSTNSTTSDKSADDTLAVQRQADSLIGAHGSPTHTVKIKMLADGTPNIGQVRRGDLARIDTSASIYLAPGFELRRITQIDGSSDGTATLSCERDDDLVEA